MRTLLRDATPPLAQVEGGRLGLAIPGEDALSVASDAHRATGGREVREVPDVLTDDGVERVEDPLVHLEHFDLVLLAPWLGGDLVQTGHGVGAVFGDDDRLVLAGPTCHLFSPVTLSGGQVASVDVPAIIAVEQQNVGVLRYATLSERSEHDVDETHRTGGVGCACHVEEGEEVVFGGFSLRLWLIGDGPDDDAGVVFISSDKVSDDLGMNLLGLVIDGLRGESRVALGAKNAATQTHVYADSRGFVDNEQTMTVGVVEDTLGVGVMDVRSEFAPIHSRQAASRSMRASLWALPMVW